MQHPHPSAFPRSPLSSNNPYNSPAPQLASGAANVANNHRSLPQHHTNPFRTPRHTPSASGSSAAFSPISPIEEETAYRPAAIAQPSSFPQPRTMSQEPRKSADLRTLDGKPYPGTESSDAKPRKVKVAQDMYAGDQPPGYDTHGYKATAPAEKREKSHKHTASCQKCGGHKRDPSAAVASSSSSAAATAAPPTTSPTSSPVQPQNIDCSKCGGKRSTPPSSFPGAAVRMQPMYPPVQSSEAGPSNVPRGKPQCTKCGRRKRPESMSTSGSASPQRVSNHRSIPSIQTNGIPVDINIEPPTAVNERAPTFPASNGSPVGAPLTKAQGPSQGRPQQMPQPERKPSRSGSISRLFRSLSRRKSSRSGSSSPTQAMPTEGPSNSRQSASYARLSVDDRPDRPPSPFSFVDKPREEQAFEMNDIRQSKLPERRDSWDKADESTMFLGVQPSRPKIGRSQSTTAAKYPGEASKPVDDIYLSLPPDQRPGITRFKSLRGGVTRAANGLSRSASQISRSTSLRRLESVKKVPSLWYRDDMAIEGAASEYDHYGY